MTDHRKSGKKYSENKFSKNIYLYKKMIKITHTAQLIVFSTEFYVKFHFQEFDRKIFQLISTDAQALHIIIMIFFDI